MQSEMEDPTQHFGLTGQGLDGSTDFLDKDNKELKDMDKEIIRIEKEKSFAKWTEQEQEREQVHTPQLSTWIQFPSASTLIPPALSLSAASPILLPWSP